MEVFTNNNYKLDDLEAWKKYKNMPTPENRGALLKRFDGLIQNTVNKWSGSLPRDVLLNEAKVLAAKGFDTYKPTGGAALATHITNAMMPISRTVYTYQNTARLPENITMKVRQYNNAVEHLTAMNGREPSIDELNRELGWSHSELQRMKDYNRKDLVESGNDISGNAFNTTADSDDILLDCVYNELPIEDRAIFSDMTGYNTKALGTSELMKKYNLNQAQLSYKKVLLTKKVKDTMSRISGKMVL